MVKPSYFAKGYVKHMDWVRAWGECLRVDYLPNVDIRTVKPKAKDIDDPDKGIKSAIAETLKYAIKPEDMIGDESLQAVGGFMSTQGKYSNCDLWQVVGRWKMP